MAADNLKAPGMVDMDLGQAVAQATLMAIEQGLGCCCQGSQNWKKVEKAFGFADQQRIVVVQTVGYPAESKGLADSGRANLSRICSISTRSTTPSRAMRRWSRN